MQSISESPKFHHPFTMVVSGGTGSGKTRWLMRFLEHSDEMCDMQLTIFYCYGEANEYTLELENRGGVKTNQGVPSEHQIKYEAMKSGGKLLLVLDDLLLNLKSTFLDTLFTKGSHNWNVSVVLVTQHLFAKELRTARNNAHYVVLMRNLAGELQARNIGVQLFPKRLPYFMEAYSDATRDNYSYLLIDMHPKTDDKLRLRTYIFPGEITIVYIAKM
jgi:hypothetical protein